MPPFSKDNDKWRAVSARDAAADGHFIYGVRTTRIYCRPNCKARLARRANVVFFSDTRTAESAGFRACKRCKPAVSGAMPDDEAVERIRRLVEGAADSPEALNTRNPDGSTKRGAARLATQARVSRWHFHRKFKEVMGMTPRAYLQKRESEARARNEATANTTSSTDCESATPARSVQPASLFGLPWPPLDPIPDWFDFGTLMSLPDEASADNAVLDSDALDIDSMADFEKYLDGIDPCLLQLPH